MSEAIINASLGDTWQAYSAGTEPSGMIHPKTLQVLKEIGIYHTGYSKSIDEYKDFDFDLVVTVCDDAAETCPVWLGRGRRVHSGFPDPAKATGSEEEVLDVFRQVRDGILTHIPALLAQWEKATND